MNIELKLLNKKFYSKESNGMLLNPIPGYSTEGSAAIDLVCTEDVTLYPGETKMISTGIAVWIGSQHNIGQSVSRAVDDFHTARIAGMILPRSGLGTKGLILANTIGLIDEDYQGELKVSAWYRLQDYGHNKIILNSGDRFAQLMFIPVIRAQFKVVNEFSNITNRGTGGFGSTGE